MVKVGKWIAKHRVLMLIIGFLLIIPSVIGMAKTRVNYDLLSYLPEHLETVKGQDILVDEYGMGAFSMVVVENMDMKDVQKLEDQFSEVPHVKDVLWYDDVADISLPVEMIPNDLKEAFFKGDATMMLVLFDNTTSSDEAMDAVGQMRKLANDQCFICGMTGVVTDIKNLALKELPVYVVIAALLSLVVLEPTSGSFVVPILFLISIGLAILYNLGLVAVGFLDGARCLLAVVRLYGGRLDVAQASDMEKEQQGHHHGDHHDGSDAAERRLLTAANVLFARDALVVSLGHLRIPFEQTNCHQLYCHAVICVMR